MVIKNEAMINLGFLLLSPKTKKKWEKDFFNFRIIKQKKILFLDEYIDLPR